VLTLPRAQAAGGFVDSEGYLCGTLGVSRALGDWLHVCARDGKPLKTPAPAGGVAARSPLSAEADIREQELTSEDEFLILACDGLWDVISSQNAVQLARSHMKLCSHTKVKDLKGSGVVAAQACKRRVQGV
jgi:protein phosphatase 2C family protein 2/3